MAPRASGRPFALPAVAAGASLLGLLALVGTVASPRSTRADAPRVRADEPRPPVPVLVELFTSEGCSSCPPAEEELLRLEHDQPVAGAEVVVVGFHVDYWNDLGWGDPFSSASWSDRQRDYDRATGRVYTPQAIVQGGEECVGSDDPALRSLARRAASAGAARLSVTPSRSPEASTVRVSVGVGAGALRADAELRVILVERGVVVDVPRGENGGRRLRHAPLARDLASAGVATAAGVAFEATLRIPPSAHRENLEVVAVAQEPASRRVVGVGVSTL